MNLYELRYHYTRINPKTGERIGRFIIDKDLQSTYVANPGPGLDKRNGRLTVIAPSIEEAIEKARVARRTATPQKVHENDEPYVERIDSVLEASLLGKVEIS